MRRPQRRIGCGCRSCGVRLFGSHVAPGQCLGSLPNRRSVGVEELELALELPDVVKLAVHGREPHVRDAVERTEKPECSIADESGVDLGESEAREARPRPRSSTARHPRARSAASRSPARGPGGASVGRTAGGGRRACVPTTRAPRHARTSYAVHRTRGTRAVDERPRDRPRCATRARGSHRCRPGTSPARLDIGTPSAAPGLPCAHQI